MHLKILVIKTRKEIILILNRIHLFYGLNVSGIIK